MTVKKESNVPPEKLTAYKKLIRTIPGIELKGATIPYTSYQGHMFSYFEKDATFGLRLPKTEREEFLKKYKTTLFVSFGMVMKEYVLVPDELLLNTKKLKPYFEISFNYVASLKPK